MKMHQNFVALATVALCTTVHAQWNMNGSKLFYNTNNVGVGVSNPAHKLDVRTPGTRAINAYSTAATGTTYGVYARSNSTTGRGVFGHATANSGVNYGVYGQTNSPEGFAGYFLGGMSYFEGNVGIGTDAPTAPLEIHGGPSDTAFTIKPGTFFGSDGNACTLDLPNLATLAIWDRCIISEGLVVDWSDVNDGTLLNALTFGANSGEGISSNRTFGAENQFGLDFYTASARRMSITTDGDVGIGTAAPAFTLEVNGDAGKPGGGSWSTSSDRRLKKNIANLHGSLDLLLALRGVNFEYIDPQAINELAGQRIGMIAQEVEEVVPDWVSQRADGYKAITYRGFEALTVEALRDLRHEKDDQINQQAAEIDELRQTVNAQQKMIEAMSQRLDSIERAPATGK